MATARLRTVLQCFVYDLTPIWEHNGLEIQQIIVDNTPVNVKDTSCLLFMDAIIYPNV